MHFNVHSRVSDSSGLVNPSFGHHVQHISAHCRIQQRQRINVQNSRSLKQPGNAVVSSVVTLMTESLRLLGTGRDQYERVAHQVSPNEPLAPGDITGMIERLQQDYERAYFVTGVIDDSIYDDQCTFADPTVKFSGLQLWKRNLQLLVPFLVNPRIDLLSMKQLREDEQGAQKIQAQWHLQTGIALPWRPFVDVIGSTVYTLNTTANKVVLHVETWDITPAEALWQIFRPGHSES